MFLSGNSLREFRLYELKRRLVISSFCLLNSLVAHVRIRIMASDASFSARIRSNFLTRYGAAFVGIAGALLIARSLNPILGIGSFYVAAFPALAFSAWCCGLGPSVGTTFVALVGLTYWFLIPVSALTIRLSLPSILTFLVAAALMVAMGEVRRRENHALRTGNGELEERVRERTLELDTANQELRELTAQLMQSQDEERRRIARELHDSVGQTLAALTMNLTTVVTDIEKLAETGKHASDSLALVQGMTKEVRTVSYLLHPPLLDEAGLASALRWYVDGYSKRSNIQVDLDMPDDFGRLPQELETAIFRTVQECLTNIHRHSRSLTAKICLARSESEIRLMVEDNGVGMPADKLDEVDGAGALGVGVRGMRERLRQLGGRLDIHSDDSGTRVEALLPVLASSTVAA